MTDSGNLNPYSLLRSFTMTRLDGDLDRLKDLDLSDLRGDRLFGCPNRSFDCDDTNIARAVYVLVYQKAFPTLSMETLDDRTYRGDTMNSFRTLFGKMNDGKAEIEDIMDVPEPLSVKIHRFFHTYHTIGNLVPLPNKKTTTTLNVMRARLWNDYFDHFLIAVRDYLYEQSYHETFTPLMEANDFAFGPYTGTEWGFATLLERLLLQGYNDDGSLMHSLPIALKQKKTATGTLPARGREVHRLLHPPHQRPGRADHQKPSPQTPLGPKRGGHSTVLLVLTLEDYEYVGQSVREFYGKSQNPN